MSAAGVSTKVRIAIGVGCAIALLAGTRASIARAGDADEAPATTAWKAAPGAKPDAIAAAATPPSTSDGADSGSSVPSAATSLPMTITTPDSGELRAVPVGAVTPPSNLASTPSDSDGTPSATQEIPIATNESAAAPPFPQNQDIDTPTTPTAPAANQDQQDQQGHFDLDSPDVQNYERAQSGMMDPGQQFQNMNNFLAEGSFTSPIGVELREGRRKLKDGEEADGLMILQVVKGSPAASAGLHGYKHTAHTAMTGAAVIATMFFPPAIFILPVLDYTHAGESYDMIIGVDGSRVTNYLDFEDRMHDVRPGEIVYLSVLRDGRREQIKIFLPPTNSFTW